MKKKTYCKGLAAVFLCLILFAAIQVNAAESVRLTAEVPQTHAVALVLGEHGAVQLDGKTYTGTATADVERLKEQTYTLVPDAGWLPDKVFYNGETVELVENSFTAPALQENARLEVSFKAVPENPVPVSAAQPSVPITGDDRNFAGYFALLLLSGTTVFLLRRKKNNCADAA